jgi:agmatinase
VAIAFKSIGEQTAFFYSFVIFQMESFDQLYPYFDPNAPGVKGKLFGLPLTPEQARVVIVPVPWEVTVSYLGGTAKAPDAVLKASGQIDLYHRHIPEVWKLGVSLLPVTPSLYEENQTMRMLAQRHIRALEEGQLSDASSIITGKVNEACESLNIYVKNVCSKWLSEGKVVGVLGGDHSTPLGLLRALSERYERFAVLQLDAHADLRKSYEGFHYSHASIMYNALKLPAVGKIVQVGIRDFCDEEMEMMKRAGGRVKTFFDSDLKAEWYAGKTWAGQCEQIIKELPPHIYISFDIDGLDPKLCPHTGTPVPGGFDWGHISYLLQRIVHSGKKIIGFDLCEVSGEAEWDASVGARVLWELSNAAAVSNRAN